MPAAAQAQTFDSKPPRPTLDDAQRILEELLGFKAFRSYQGPIIEALLEGSDALALMPTGGGKSLCYQIPALARSGTGIVVSPLIALMQDQVDALRELGIAASFLNSSQSLDEQNDVVRALTNGDLDLFYIAPERLMQPRTLAMLEGVELSVIAIDEAHCVSQWGHDFRPEYRQLRVLADRFPDVPRIALTATADVRTRDEIITELKLQNARKFVASFDRPNIRYQISEPGARSARERLWQFIDAQHAEDAGIIYCLSRKSTEQTAQWLCSKGRVALCYHAGLPNDERRETQTRFLNEEGMIIVATTAFGMGIDKPDVRFVAHLNLPKTIEAYYQETGRAGRDGEPASAWMTFGLQDVVKLRQWIVQGDGTDAFKKIQNRKLDSLIGLSEMAGCRRQALLAYFDETLVEPCGNCDNCLHPPKTIDATRYAQMALSAAYRTGQRFGVGYLVDILLGKPDPRATQNGHDKLSVFGIGAELDANAWRSLFRQLTSAGYLVGDDDGYGTLALTHDARPLLRGQTSFVMRDPAKQAKLKSRSAKKSKRTKGAGATTSDLSSADENVFEALRELRTKLAKRSKVPPYVIFHDATLKELARKLPQAVDALNDITGLGVKKIEKYGAALVDVLQGFKPDPVLQNNLSETVNVTFALHLEGLDAQVIAQRRELDTQTIMGHFADVIEAGLAEPSKVIGLDESEIDEITHALDDHDVLETGKLKPAFDALGGRYGYGVLKCVLAAKA